MPTTASPSTASERPMAATAPCRTAPYVDRLVMDAWAAVASFLVHEDLAALSVVSRALREVACGNGVWEWLLRRDFGHGPLQLAEERWGWMGRGGLPGARDERDFIRGYYRLLRSVPPAPARFDAADVAAVDELYRAAPLAWRPARQFLAIATIAGEGYDAWMTSSQDGQGGRGGPVQMAAYLRLGWALMASGEAVLSDRDLLLLKRLRGQPKINSNQRLRQRLRRQQRAARRRQGIPVGSTSSDDDDDDDESKAGADVAGPASELYVPKLSNDDRRRLVATRLDPQIGFRAAAARSIYRVLQRFAPVTAAVTGANVALWLVFRQVLPGLASAVPWIAWAPLHAVSALRQLAVVYHNATYAVACALVPWFLRGARVGDDNVNSTANATDAATSDWAAVLVPSGAEAVADIFGEPNIASGGAWLAGMADVPARAVCAASTEIATRVPNWAEPLVGLVRDGVCGSGGTVLVAAAGVVAVAAWAVKRGFREGAGQSRALRHLNGWTGPLVVSVLGAGLQSYCVARLVHSADFLRIATLPFTVLPVHLALFGPMLAVAALIIVFMAEHKASGKLAVLFFGGVATVAVHLVSWVLLGGLAMVAPLAASTSTTTAAESTTTADSAAAEVVAASPRSMYLVLMALWPFIDGAMVNSIPGIRGFRIDESGSKNTCPSLTAILTNAVGEPSSIYYTCYTNRGRWTWAYSVLSTGVSIAVAAATGGDAHKAALAKAGTEVALGLLHHVGRVIAHGTTSPPDDGDDGRNGRW